jgi:hypothetical protein
MVYRPRVSRRDHDGYDDPPRRGPGRPKAQKPDKAGRHDDAPPRRRAAPRNGIDRNEMRVYQNEREQATHERLERLLSSIVNRGSKPEFGALQALMEFEEARMVALTAYPPQANAAVNATLAKAKIMGLVIDRQAIGKPTEFNGSADEEEKIFEHLSERIGAAGAEQFMAFVANMRAALRGEVIEGTAEEVPE